MLLPDLLAVGQGLTSGNPIIPSLTRGCLQPDPDPQGQARGEGTPTATCSRVTTHIPSLSCRLVSL